MANTQIEITGLDKLLANVRRFPEITRARLQDAVAAGAAEVMKQATRENVPWRTGNLTQSFGRGITIGELFATIRPMTDYAAKVNEKSSKPHYIERMAELATPSVLAHFNTAAERIAADIAKT